MDAPCCFQGPDLPSPVPHQVAGDDDTSPQHDLVAMYKRLRTVCGAEAVPGGPAPTNSHGSTPARVAARGGIGAVGPCTGEGEEDPALSPAASSVFSPGFDTDRDVTSASVSTEGGEASPGPRGTACFVGGRCVAKGSTQAFSNARNCRQAAPATVNVSATVAAPAVPCARVTPRALAKTLSWCMSGTVGPAAAGVGVGAAGLALGPSSTDAAPESFLGAASLRPAKKVEPVVAAATGLLYPGLENQLPTQAPLHNSSIPTMRAGSLAGIVGGGGGGAGGGAASAAPCGLGLAHKDPAQDPDCVPGRTAPGPRPFVPSGAAWHAPFGAHVAPTATTAPTAATGLGAFCVSNPRVGSAAMVRATRWSRALAVGEGDEGCHGPLPLATQTPQGPWPKAVTTSQQRPHSSQLPPQLFLEHITLQ
jgi:hypothetical protein